MELRDLTPADAPALARLHVAAWQTAYRGLLPDAYLDGLQLAAFQSRWQKLLAEARHEILALESAGELLGWACFGADRDHPEAREQAELQSLSLHPERKRQGLGTRLLEQGVSRLRQRTPSPSTLVVWVLEDNLAARAFYQRQGFAAEPIARQPLVLGGRSLIEIKLSRALDTGCIQPIGFNS